MHKHAFLRALALPLLVATIVGPLGLAEVLHPADDALCTPEAGGATHAATTIGHDDGGPGAHAHCAVCHALRSVRWALASIPFPALNAQPAPHAQTVLKNPEFDAPQHPGSGRSPPFPRAIA